jgi:hypothetical protein
MRNIRWWAGVAFVTMAAACGGKAKSADIPVAEIPDPHVDAGAGCSLHFTGGPIADPDLPCTIEADYVLSTSRTVVEIGGDSGQLTVHFNLTRPGELDSGVVTNGQGGITGLLDITNGDADYEMTTAPGSETGSFSFSVTRVNVAVTSDRARNYTLVGSLDATVPADTTTKATGTVVVHVTFGGQ